MIEYNQFILINMTNKFDYLADDPVVSSLVGIFLCLYILCLIGCLILIRIYLKNLHQLIKWHLVSSFIQQIAHHIVLFGIFLVMVIYRKQNWLTCTLMFRILGGSVTLGAATNTMLSILRYHLYK